MTRERLTYAQKNCIASAGKLMKDLEMVHPGARIGVALSGGADSWVLMRVLAARQRILPFDIELMGLHINPGFDPNNHHPLIDWLETEGFSYCIETTDHGPRAHSEENRKNSPCFFCCRRRRKRLFEMCRKFGLTHLAFGHNCDDLAATFFMNLFFAGRVEALSPKEHFFNDSLTIIRPLMWLEKSTIIRAQSAWRLPIWTNPCPSAGSTQRTKVMDRMQEIWKDDKRIKNNVYNALRRRGNAFKFRF